MDCKALCEVGEAWREGASKMSAVTHEIQFKKRSEATKHLVSLGFVQIGDMWMHYSNWAAIKHLPASNSWLVQVGVVT